MHKKLFLILAFVFFFSFTKSVFAFVVINEVQIETDSNKDDEFIELYNNGNTEIDLTNFSIYKKTSSGSESSIVAKSRFENKKIPANGILFLAREGEYTGSKTVDIYWPNSYSLAPNNSLTLYKDFENKTIEDSVSWGEVKTFKRSNTNTESENTSTENTNQNVATTASGSSSLSASSQTITKKNPELKILAKNFGFVGMPINFESIMLNEEYRNIYGKYFWNFGDGEIKELTSLENIPFTHTYFYPGEYNIYLEYYRTTHEFKPYLTSQIVINIVEPTLVISATGEEDFFIEVSNKANMNLDLTNFTLRGLNKNFIFPKNTFLNKDKKIILSPKITNFNLSDKNFLEILDPSGKIIYSQKIIPQVKGISTKKVSSSNKNFIAENNENISQDFDENLDILNEENTKDLIPYKEENENNWNVIFIFILVVLGMVALVYFIRKSNTKKEIEEEFEILDE